MRSVSSSELQFAAKLVSGEVVEVGGLWGVEKRRLWLRSFYSLPYSIPTHQVVDESALRELTRIYPRGEISSRKPFEGAIAYKSPVIRRTEDPMRLYHRERRRLIRRASEIVDLISFEKSREVVDLINLTRRRFGSKPLNLMGVLELPLCDVVGVYVSGSLEVGLLNLKLSDRYLLWQVGWRRRHKAVYTFIYHVAIKRAFELGYEIVDFGITFRKEVMRFKLQMGCDPESHVYVFRW